MSKSRAPKINKEKLAENSPLVTKLSGRKTLFKEYQQQVERDELNHSFVALLALREMRFLRNHGYSEEEIETIIPNEWRQGTPVCVPESLLIEILSRFEDYLDAGPGKTFGECFGIEGGGQGRVSMRDRHRKTNERIEISNAVGDEYYGASADEQPISVEAAIAKVAEQKGISESKARMAYNLKKPRLKAGLKARGII
jgi:hypothetical protein